MNRYGVIAQRHWESYAPSRTAALGDPTRFFTDLGLQVQAQVLQDAGPAREIPLHLKCAAQWNRAGRHNEMRTRIEQRQQPIENPADHRQTDDHERNHE